MSSYLLKPKFGGSKVLYLNSANATSYIGVDSVGEPLSTHYTYSLPDPIVVPDSQKCLVSLYNATIPNSFYTIRKGENDLLPIYFTWANHTGSFTQLAYPDPANQTTHTPEAKNGWGGDWGPTIECKNKGKQGAILQIPAGYYTAEELAERVCAEVEACPLMSGIRQTQWFYPWGGYNNIDTTRPSSYQTIAEYNADNSYGDDDDYPNAEADITYIGSKLYATRPPNDQLSPSILGDFINFAWRWDKNSNRIVFYCGTKPPYQNASDTGSGYPYGLNASGTGQGPFGADGRGGALPQLIDEQTYQWLFPIIAEVGFMFGAPPDDWFQTSHNTHPAEAPATFFEPYWVDTWAPNFAVDGDRGGEDVGDAIYPWFNKTIGPALGFYDGITTKHIAFYPNNWADYNDANFGGVSVGGRGHRLPHTDRAIPWYPSAPGVSPPTFGFEYYFMPPYFTADKKTFAHQLALTGKALAYEQPKFLGLSDFGGPSLNAEYTFLAYAAHTSPRSPDPEDGIHGLFVNQNLVSNSALDNTSGVFGNTLGRIPISAGPNNLIIQRPSDATHQSLVDLKSIDSIELQLTDDRNRPIDLNGLDWQVGILIQFVENVPEDTTNLSRAEIENSLIDNSKVLAPSFQTELPEEEGRDYLKRLKESVAPKTKGKTKN